MKRYKINEIFGPTIQGEGSFAGVPVAFVRFSGCNRKCDFCDTDFNTYEELTAFDIVRRINNLGLGFKIVVLTGGEPTLQLDDELCSMLSLRWDLHLETNGSNYITSIEDYFEHISCSPKQSPDETRCSYHDIKLIWPYQDNYAISDYEVPHCRRFIQPIHGHDVTSDKELMLELYRTNSRLSVQTHKFLGLK